MATHRLANGQRVVDRLGRDDADIGFSGVFAGPDASLRARALDELRASGVLIPLTWDVFFYTVVVREFVASYQNDAWIPYALRCTVVRDEAESIEQVPGSILEQLTSDISTASDSCAEAGIDIGDAAATVRAPGASMGGTGSFQRAQDSLGSADLAISTRIDGAEQQLSRADLTGGSAEAALMTLSTAAVAARNLAWLVQARGFVGRAMVNLASGGI